MAPSPSGNKASEAHAGEGMDHEDNREDPSVMPSGLCAHSGHDAVFPGKNELSEHLIKASLSADGMDEDAEKHRVGVARC